MSVELTDVRPPYSPVSTHLINAEERRMRGGKLTRCSLRLLEQSCSQCLETLRHIRLKIRYPRLYNLGPLKCLYRCYSDQGVDLVIERLGRFFDCINAAVNLLAVLALGE